MPFTSHAHTHAHAYTHTSSHSPTQILKENFNKNLY